MTTEHRHEWRDDSVYRGAVWCTVCNVVLDAEYANALEQARDALAAQLAEQQAATEVLTCFRDYFAHVKSGAPVEQEPYEIWWAELERFDKACCDALLSDLPASIQAAVRRRELEQAFVAAEQAYRDAMRTDPKHLITPDEQRYAALHVLALTRNEAWAALQGDAQEEHA